MNRVEQQIQKSVFEHFAVRGAPGAIAWHTPNGGARSPIEAKILKGIGTRPGIPDVLALHEGRLFALELKADGGRVSSAQAETMQAMERAGATVAHAQGLDAALAQLEQWGLLRGRAV
jgi:hypothetical protein